MALVRIALVAALCVALLYLLLPITPDLSDWHLCFEPALQAMIRSGTPYVVECYYNPPWAALLLTPFGLLHGRAQDIVVMFLSSAVLGWFVLHHGWPLWGLLFLVFSTPVLGMLTFGNLEWMVILGATLPARWGILLVMIKPQAGIGLVMYWIVKAWRTSGIVGVVRVVAPFVAVVALSALIWGAFWTKGVHLPSANWNTGGWPYTIPVGLLLFLWGIAASQPLLALASSPFWSPYAGLYSFTPLMLTLTRYPKILALVVILQWVVILLMVYG
jgi:hypothetical protein